MMPNRENMTYTTAERIFAVFGPRRITSIEEARRYVRSPQALANKVYNGMLGNRPGTDDGWVYRGGGYPHLTGRGNYRDSSADAGVDLVANPEAMLDPVISGRVLILGLMDGRWNKERRGVEHYEMLDGLPGLSEVEAIAARRTVNVQDKAALIAGYYRAFRAALVAGGMVDATTATAKPVDNSPAPETDDKPRGLLAAILALLARIFGKGNA
jgi:putative chitinase